MAEKVKCDVCGAGIEFGDELYQDENGTIVNSEVDAIHRPSILCLSCAKDIVEMNDNPPAGDKR